MVMLNKGGLSRIYQMMKSPEQVFGIISASRQDLNEKENEERTKQLIKDIYNLGYGFTHMAGGYQEEGQLEPGYEHSLFVPNISKEELLKLGKKYQQDTVLYKDKDGLKYYKPDGKVEMEFKTDALIVGDNFDLEKVKPYFSQRLKGGNKRNAFTFVDKNDEYKRHKYVKENFELFAYEPWTLMGKHRAYLNCVGTGDFVSTAPLVEIIGENNMNTKEMAEFFENEVKKMDEEQEYNKDNVEELVLYTVNDGRLYDQMVMPIVKNLAKKMAKGTFDKDLAVKAFKHLADEAAKRYTKEFGSTGDNFNQLFSVPDRKQAAIEFLDYYMEDIEDKSEEVKGSKNESLINEEVEDENDELALALQDYLVNSEGDDIEELHIKNSYGNEYETGRGYEAYLVFSSYDEAVAAAEESERNLLDDIGISGIRWGYMPYSMEHYVDSDWFEAARDESNRFYVEDMSARDKFDYLEDILDEDDFREAHRAELEEIAEENITGEDAEEGITKESYVDNMELYDMLDALDMWDEYDEEIIEKLNNDSDDPVEWYIFNFGEEDFNQVVIERNLADLDEIAADIVETDGPANALAGYDGNEIEWEYDGNTYYMYRTN